jgi:hypothetical protein
MRPDFIAITIARDTGSMKWQAKGADTGKKNKKPETQNMKHHKNQHKQGSNGEENPDPKTIERRA